MKRQLVITVIRFDKKRPTWSVRVSHVDATTFPASAMLPGEFRRYGWAKSIAQWLAYYYRRSGYEVALDTGSCRRRNSFMFGGPTKVW